MARRKPDEQLKVTRCSGPNNFDGGICPNYVNIRRPSEDNLHFCPAPACQAKKQKVYRERQARKLVAAEREEMKRKMVVARRFVHAATWLPRVQCPTCGLEDAIQGYIHRGPDGPPCLGVGGGGSELSAEWFDLFHYKLKPGYQED